MTRTAAGSRGHAGLYSGCEEQTPSAGKPEFAALAAQFKDLAGFPDQVNSIFIEVSYIAAEEDRPEMVVRFRDISQDADSATLSTTAVGLRQLHASLGGILQELE